MLSYDFLKMMLSLQQSRVSAVEGYKYLYHRNEP